MDERLDDAWQRNHRELGDKMLAMTSVICDAIKSSVRDIESADKMTRVIRTGLARLQAIDSATESERDPETRLNV